MEKVQTLVFFPYKQGRNTILVLTFWDCSQFGPYILVAVNLVPVIFNLESIWSLLFKLLMENVYMANYMHVGTLKADVSSKIILRKEK